MDAVRTHALQTGQPWPLGAHFDGKGVNFAIVSEHAQAIELCLYDETGQHETARVALPGRSNDVWHGYLPGALPGLVYGLRAHGPWRPERGHRFNPFKLLLDPYAREIVGHFTWRDEHFGADLRHPLHMDQADNAAHALKARVVHDDHDWAGDEPPRTPLVDSVLYEVHVKGFSARNAAVPEALRGSYAGLAHPASIAHLKQLGITAVSLLPVHYALDEQRLVTMGLTNYWGYNTLGFFCPSPRLASSQGGAAQRAEFRAMVAALHAAGIEVLLDVVYNHTAETDETGPTLSFRGLDNALYYRLPPEHKALYENHTGCGNTLDIREPRVLQLVMDSLRYWVEHMHVDGFRFDLAPVLGRGDNGFESSGPFFTAVAQDPVLSRVKMIAEPWDIGPGGYQVGNFPRGWIEWNDKFRDSMRGFWTQAAAGRPAADRGAFALRLCGSSDLYQPRNRVPGESVNYVVSHDGFTLADLLTYEQRRNEANGESNRDGHGHNLGFNCGAEGPSSDPQVLALRGKLQRVLLATALLAQGTPMLAAGDELGHSQGGNNNPYCQDNPTTWIDWSKSDADLTAFAARVLALRRQALPFGSHWYSGLSDPLGLHDLTWLQADGSLLTGAAWQDASQRVLGCLIGKPGRARAPLLLLVNGSLADADFLLPAGVWRCWLDSTHPQGRSRWYDQGEQTYALPALSLSLLAAEGANIKID
ncbi:glycogen debranching protein GlgX [Pseudorhodoferax sp. Leaf265]|uniref:glycogen debranching protein GlgX n=1 Tax=Pseudorhodoferax sp. Leaf265 TaxID=1736315 RepID=UPI0006FBB417|nr:glycogen debranching protein GlgX [Pseudorhodoferax sp. Leaf265]KQP02095.1 glycogen debranching enzyme GlgX [Pseudorhodoferax sp. Leaf265]